MGRASTREKLILSVCDVGVKHIPNRSNSLLLQKKNINSATLDISHFRKPSSAGMTNRNLLKPSLMLQAALMKRLRPEGKKSKGNVSVNL
jgi:hypothetical protein